MKNKNWENSEYEKLIRIKVSDLEWIKNNKEDMSAAAFLHFIIQFYKAKK